jgi:nicotinamidase-related amidase
LLIIDPQKDFCDKDGSLSVPGADEDMIRLASMVDRIGSKISRIKVTLDSHHTVDVAHPAFWRNSKGENPTPFTLISSDDIKNGVWKPFQPSLSQRMLDYTQNLEKNGKFQLCIWPPHCLIGSRGHAVHDVLYASLINWETSKPWNVEYVSKGSNPFTEHYGAIEAEVPDPSDSTTQINAELVTALLQADTILVAGEAGSHCLKTTVEQIADKFGDDSYVSKIVLLTDATSPVQSPYVDFPAIQEQFINDMVARGMRTSTTVDFLK